MIISVIVIHLKNTPAALPLLALAVADKAEVAPIAAQTVPGQTTAFVFKSLGHRAPMI